ncbi:rod shape-determining protein MreC [Sphingosinicella rhizophila]|uniref:Cell shape-determining protein MreC n=1 Tax=Sphingosinicella rhizophila TaxID=3050082 RepID=A0ABU3Q3G7_9SPHN|nr:rod shape-determining protein MreC [Sphingosinicella sp. GR2756]MDT9597812.1 rod shape-determining protein MreC [Sphingosinicella sp. GR2756]
MAPPSTRRLGFSRKAHYGLFLGYVVAVAGILFALLLLVVAIFDPRGFAGLKGVALDITTPITSGGRSIVRFVGGIGDDFGNYFAAGSQNAELKERLKANRRKLIAAEAALLENRRLKSLLRLTESAPDRVAMARIVGSSFDSSRQLATMNVGTSNGVGVGQPVRAPEGLIGRVLETGRFASRVLLITDGSSNVPVQLVRDGTPAIATGRGDGTIDLKTLEVGRNPFRRGDILITSGVGGIYAPGIPVAIIAAVKGETAVARPLADPARIDFAIVESIYQPAATEPLGPEPPASREQAP